MSQIDSSERFVRSTPQSWKQTIGLIVWMAIAGVVCQFAVAYGPTDNQGVRLGLWIGVFASIIMALVMFAALLRFYKVNLLYLPSTWILLLDVVLIRLTRHQRSARLFNVSDCDGRADTLDGRFLAVLKHRENEFSFRNYPNSYSVGAVYFGRGTRVHDLE